MYKQLLLCVTSLFFLSAPSYAGQPTSSLDVFNFLKQNLPPDGQYSGQDKKGVACTLIVERLESDIKINIMGSVWGAFGILNDNSQVVDQFDKTPNSVFVTVETNAQAGGAGVSSYGVLSFKRITNSQMNFSVGAVADLMKPKPHLVYCIVNLNDRRF